MITKASVDQFLDQKAIAIVGVSRSGKKFGNAIFRELRDKGVGVVPVNPNAEEIEGVRCYADVKDVPPEAGILYLNRCAEGALHDSFIDC